MMDAEIKGAAGEGLRIARHGAEVSSWLLRLADGEYQRLWLLGYTSSDYEGGAVIELRETDGDAERPKADLIREALYEFECVTAEHRDAAHVLDVLARWLVDGYLVPANQTARVGINIRRGLRWSVRLLGNGGLAIDPARAAA